MIREKKNEESCADFFSFLLRHCRVVGVSILRVVTVAKGWGTRDYTYRYAINFIWRYERPTDRCWRHFLC